jgi:hypothetical protein
MLILATELGLCLKDETAMAFDLSIKISKNLSKFIDYLKSRT